MQELLPARPRPALYWFSEMHATDGVRVSLKRLAKPQTDARIRCCTSRGTLAPSSCFSAAIFLTRLNGERADAK